ncbi:cyclic nucleotide-binding domain-containing protein [bacterium]|nr:cyclic nucleotide-binding domain-containing protein [bacterium]
MERWLIQLGEGILYLVENYKGVCLGTLMFIATIAGYYGVQVRVENNVIGFFKEDSEIVRRIHILDNSLAGSVSFYIRVTGEPGDFLEPENLRVVDSMQHVLSSKRWVDKHVSFPDYLKLIHSEMNQGKEAFFKIPDTKKAIEEYLLFIDRGQIERFVTADYDDLTILVRHTIYSSTQLNTVLDELRQEFQEIVPRRFHVDFTGENILVNKAVDTIAAGQVLGIFMITAVIFIIMSLLFMNIKVGFYSLIPNLFPIAINFGLMTLFNIPLNTGTCMVAVVAIGIAIDDTVHLMSRYNKEMSHLQDQVKALHNCVLSEILPVLSTSSALAVGFSIFMFSDFIPIMHFGILAACVMMFAFIADMFITPILLSSTQLITLWDMVELKLRKDVIYKSNLFTHLRIWQIKKIILLGKMGEIKHGQYAVKQGEMGTTMFIILEGEASVLVQGEDQKEEIKITSFGPGDIFGEIALVNPGPRTASIRAESHMKYIEFDWSALERVGRIYPWISSTLYLNISRILGKRLADSTMVMSQK